MFAKSILALIFLLSTGARVAIAQQPYIDIEQRLSAEQLQATGLDTLSSAQLELLNRLLRGESAATATGNSETPASANRASSYIGLDTEPVTSRIKGTVDGWQPGTVFELENGQQWKVLKGSATLREPKHSPQITVVPGFAGRWFLEVDESMPKPRVYRID